jgi:hypothetical protein
LIDEEVMLAQEQGVTMRAAGLKKELEGGLGGEAMGTLVLTNRQLVFVTTHEREDDFRIGFSKFRFVYADVQDLNTVPHVPANLFIPLAKISSVTGHDGRGGLEKPSLEVKWNDAGTEVGRVFIEGLKGRSRKKNLNDWAAVIEHLKAGVQKLVSIPKAPGIETLEGKVMMILADMQRKGLFEVENDVETAFKVKLDPDEVQSACDSLAHRGLVKRVPDSGGDIYYRKLSPLGEDDLSDY